MGRNSDNMSEKLRRVTFNIGAENYEKLGNLAAAKGVSVPEFVWNLVLETIEDDEDIQEAMKAWDDKDGTVTLEECIRQREKEGL
jgi:hypothetical protein